MNSEHKPIWETINNVAEIIQDPTKKAEAKALAEKMQKENRKATQELIGRLFISRILDLSAIFLLVVLSVLVFIFFTSSLFEGFVAFILSFWFIKGVFKNRNNDLFSKFQGWF